MNDGSRAGDSDRADTSSLGCIESVGTVVDALAVRSGDGLEWRRDADRVEGDCDRGGVLGTAGILPRAGDSISDDDI